MGPPSGPALLAGIPANDSSKPPPIKRFFLNDNALQQVWRKHSNELVVVAVPPPPQRMQPIPAAESWDIVPITSIAELAEWVGYEVDELLWFADLKGLGFRRKESKLRHYSYRILTKNSSSSVRVIESPKRRLKDIQIQILKCLLQKIPPHESVHGFVKKRSVTTFVAPHVSQVQFCAWMLRISSPLFQQPGFKPSFALSDILSRWPIFSAHSAPQPLHATSGERSRPLFLKSARSTHDDIFRRVRRLPHCLRISAFSYGLSPEWLGEICRRSIHPLRRRPCRLRQRPIGPGR